MHIKIKKFFTGLSRKQIIIGSVVLVVVIGIIFAYSSGGSGTSIATAEKGAIEEEVLATGQTTAITSVKLGFEKSGKVAINNIMVGSRVVEGQTLVVLEQAELLADLHKAQANLDKALVELASTQRGASSSNSTASSNLVKEIRNAYIEADGAVRNNADQFFTNPRDFSVIFDPSFIDGGTTYLFGIPQNVKSGLSDKRREIEYLLVSWEQLLSDNPENNLDESFKAAKSNLETIQTFLDQLASAMNNISSVDYTYDATIQGYKNTVSTARSNIVTVLGNLLTAKEKYDNAPYEISGVGSALSDVLVQEAVVAGLQADVDSYQALLGKTVLRAPISGIVTQADAKRGEIVTAGTPLVSIISDNKLQVEANVSEVNIGRVSVGNKVAVTFDAFPQEEFWGSVTYIDPAETLVDAVPTYKVTVSFSNETTERIRSGLTANLRILTASKENAIKIPIYAVERKDGKSFVQVVTGGNNTEERLVETGLRGKDGSIEVVSGLSEGEVVLVDGR